MITIRFGSTTSREAAEILAVAYREQQQDAVTVLDTNISEIVDEDDGPIAILLIQVPRIAEMEVEATVTGDARLVEELVRTSLERSGRVN